MPASRWWTGGWDAPEERCPRGCSEPSTSAINPELDPPWFPLYKPCSPVNLRSQPFSSIIFLSFSCSYFALVEAWLGFSSIVVVRFALVEALFLILSCIVETLHHQ